MIKSFIYPEIKEEDRIFGGGLFTEPIIKPDGDWRAIKIPDEDQNVAGVESSACYIEAQQSTDASLKEFQYNILDENDSARFNALLSGGTESGGDPIKGALSMKNDGVVPQWMMDWGNYIKSWADFHSWKGVDKDKCLLEGKKDASLWDKKFKIIAEKDTPLKTKYINLREGLKRSPCPLSVCAWYEKNGKYYKPNGMRDTHLVKAEYVDKDNSIWIKDTYFPYIKVLEPNTDFEFAMYRTINRKLEVIHRSFLEILKGMVILLQTFYEYTKKNMGDFIGSIFNKRQD